MKELISFSHSISITNYFDFISNKSIKNFDSKKKNKKLKDLDKDFLKDSKDLSKDSMICHDSIVNYCRSSCRDELYCVMCGLRNKKECEIPNQNKDICNLCDSLFWKVIKLNEVVKFCKGCKKFCHLNVFGDKPLAAKCAKCRQRFLLSLYFHCYLSCDVSFSCDAFSSSCPFCVSCSSYRDPSLVLWWQQWSLTYL